MSDCELGVYPCECPACMERRRKQFKEKAREELKMSEDVDYEAIYLESLKYILSVAEGFLRSNDNDALEQIKAKCEEVIQ